MGARPPEITLVTKTGKKQHFASGATRHDSTGKGRPDLISPFFRRRLALLMERGARSHGPRNWENGVDFSRCVEGVLRHWDQWLAGDRDEDHLIATVWNLHALVHYGRADSPGHPAGELERSTRLPHAEEGALMSKTLQKGDRVTTLSDWLKNNPKECEACGSTIELAPADVWLLTDGTMSIPVGRCNECQEEMVLYTMPKMAVRELVARPTASPALRVILRESTEL